MQISLKSRLTLIVSIIVIVTLIGQGFLLLHNWKEAIRSEIYSSYNLAKKLVGSSLISPASSLNQLQKDEIIGVLEGMRHVQVMVTYGDKESELTQNQTEIESVPAWFSKLIYPYDEPLPKVSIRSFSTDSVLTIQADTQDEIAEVWEDFKIQSLITICFSIFIIILVYLGLHVGLKPLNDLQRGFSRLQKGNFNIHVDENVSSELSYINQKFNHMVAVLRETSEDNSLLVHKLVDIQEEERRAVSRELHDEMGPRLFTIRVSLSKAESILNENKKNEIKSQLKKIDDDVVDLQTHMRKLLRELRPLILDDLSLSEAIHSLVENAKIEAEDIDWQIELSGLDSDLDDTIKVTSYRIVQECMTNILRHSKASRASIAISLQRTVADKNHRNNASCSDLLITVEDNGVGLTDTPMNGLGIIGMRERVKALGGILTVNSKPNGGVSINASIPITK